MARWKQDERKLRELILFIATHGADEEGDVFLDKVLFFSDAFALQRLGRPITGARYQKPPLSPTSPRSPAARRNAGRPRGRGRYGRQTSGYPGLSEPICRALRPTSPACRTGDRAIPRGRGDGRERPVARALAGVEPQSR